MKELSFYRCSKCGNLVLLVNDGGGQLTCCGQAMQKLKANSTDADAEKHVPVLVSGNNGLEVAVGSVLHPMTPEHYIEWIALEVDDKVEIIYLKPNMEPKAAVTLREKLDDDGNEVVPNCEGSVCNFVEKAPFHLTAYAYCNLHGLWKMEL